MNTMRFRKTNALIGALLAVGALFMVYLVIDTISVQYEEAELQKVIFTLSLHINFIIGHFRSYDISPSLLTLQNQIFRMSLSVWSQNLLDSKMIFLRTKKR